MKKTTIPNERTCYLAPEIIRKINNGKSLKNALISLDLSRAAFYNWCRYTGTKYTITTKSHWYNQNIYGRTNDSDRFVNSNHNIE